MDLSFYTAGDALRFGVMFKATNMHTYGHIRKKGDLPKTPGRRKIDQIHWFGTSLLNSQPKAYQANPPFSW